MANAPYANGSVTVGTTPTLIASPGLPGGIALQNLGSEAVTLGGALVTASTGPTLPATMTQPIIFPTAGPLHDLFGITSTGTSIVVFAFVA